MINIRYHVYSLVAVFLALAIGVAAGSTVVQRSVVDNLKSTQGRIEKNLDDLEAKNAELEDRASALEGRSGTLTQQGPAAFLTDELAGTHVMVLRAQGTSNDALDRVRDGLKVAGADTVSDVELKAALADPDTLATFGAQLDLTPEQQSQPDQVQAAIGQRLGELIAAVHAERTVPSPTSEPSTADTSATSDTTAPTPTTDAAGQPGGHRPGRLPPPARRRRAGLGAGSAGAGRRVDRRHGARRPGWPDEVGRPDPGAAAGARGDRGQRPADGGGRRRAARPAPGQR